MSKSHTLIDDAQTASIEKVKRKSARGYTRAAAKIDYVAASDEILPRLAGKRFFGVAEVRRLTRFSHTSAKLLIDNLVERTLAQEIEKRGRKKTWVVIRRLDKLLKGESVRPPSKLRPLRLSPGLIPMPPDNARDIHHTEALRMVIAIHDPGPMRAALEKALDIIEKITALSQT